MSESNYSESSEESTAVLKPVDDTPSDAKDVETTQMTHPESEEESNQGSDEDSDEESEGEAQAAQKKDSEASVESDDESSASEQQPEKGSAEEPVQEDKSENEADDDDEQVAPDLSMTTENEDKEAKKEEEEEVTKEVVEVTEDVVPATVSEHVLEPETEAKCEDSTPEIAKDVESKSEDKEEKPVDTAAIKASFSQGSAAPSQGSASADKFREPVLKEKIKNPVLLENAGQKHGAGIDKFHEPVLKTKIKNPVSFSGQKHSAGAATFESKVALEKGLRNPTFGYLKSSFTGISKFTEPIAVSSGKTDSLKRSEWGKGGPKGSFKWVQVGGSWKKQYDA
ncbi:hypothetical protein FisN_3Hh102 [Fistulifera solaris]|uniref:Uncharacterized protein n=1 Tax=Fistulifera solaris TaxID=1519565 RepID=A0A1Z5JNM9_FISSO|nr:hypothetical protein FisN_3Hh102 [Fistulifera solaris]|eukprot:GAX15630.1 hypothetical protein FisN_3Hh102 [Fistulifera solaris]